MDSKNSELRALESQWKNLDDGSIIREVLFKGKYLSNAIKFISDRNNTDIERVKENFLEVCFSIVNVLIKNRQFHRAFHVLKNAQVNEIYYFYETYSETEDEDLKKFILDHIRRLDVSESEETLEAWYGCFKLLGFNIERHAKFLDSVNHAHKTSIITVNNYHKTIFGTFMKQPVPWRNEIAVDVFFKSKNDTRNLLLLPILDKFCFFNYILQNELYGLLKRWINENYLCRVGGAISNTLHIPENYEEALNFLFRAWKLEPCMMDKISRREKNVIKNEFAKLGLFEFHETKQTSRKMNRFFTTYTFEENVHSLESDEITKLILEHKLIDLLPERFIDHKYIENLLRDNPEGDDQHKLTNDLKLLESMKDLFSQRLTLEDFIHIVNDTTDYVKKYDSNDAHCHSIKFLNDSITTSLDEFEKISEINELTRNLFIKLNTIEQLPSVEELLETFHAINIDYIRNEFESTELDHIPSFNDAQISSTYADNVTINFINFIKKNQGAYATYEYITDIIKGSMTLTRPQIMSGCDEVCRLVMDNPENEAFVAHAVTFLESLSVDSRNLRCFLQLLKLKKDQDVKHFEKFLNASVKISDTEEDLKLVEALEVFWHVKKYTHPSRSYLNPYLNSNDWFRLVLIAEYLNYPLESFIAICQDKIGNKTLSDNLIRAVSYDSPVELRRQCSFNKRRRSQSEGTELEKIFTNGKFLDSKSDLFAILLKCNENASRLDLPFEAFQKFFLKHEETDDLLSHAVKHDWPLISVLAATSKLYRFKYCWLTWLILSSGYKWKIKYETVEELAESAFTHCLKIGFVKTLNDSFEIFYPDSPLKLFSRFLLETKRGNFNGMDSLLKLFIVKLNEQNYTTIVMQGKQNLIPFIIRCLILHLQNNIKFTVQQEEYLECLHRSEIAQFDGKIDFDFLQKLTKILENTNVKINFEEFHSSEKRSSHEMDRICDELIKENYFQAAIEVADLMNASKHEFVFKYWLHMYKTENQRQTSFDIEKYLKYVEIYKLSMEVFLKFLAFIVDEMEECADKYNIMKFILRNSKSEDAADVEELEYEIILLYVKLKIACSECKIEPLTSLYYDNVIAKERSLIHNSFNELKEIAKIDEMTISCRMLSDEEQIKKLEELMLLLLDRNDIIQVLRIKEFFGHAPQDLQLLVYMLSVSEGITSIYDITKKERQTISSYGHLSNRFNRFALRPVRTSSSNSMSSSMLSMDINESGASDESTRFKENRETFEALQGLVCKIKHGVKYGHRIVLIYRISLLLNKSFNELIRIKNSLEFLELAALQDCENKLLILSDIIEAMEMTNIEITEFIAKEITACIIRTRFLQFNKDTDMNTSAASYQSFDDIWGFCLSKDLHLILELCKNHSTLLGHYLLKFYDILSQPQADIPIHSKDPELEKLCALLNRSLSPQIMSLKKQNIIRVELLITAHDCFCHECSTEGIGKILNLSKALVNGLAEKRSFNLIVKLLCGIGRYREMFYCFDILIKNEAFEALLGQFNDKESSGIKTAILSYLNENHPNNKEYYKMAASYFLMHTEMAKIWRASASEKIQKLLSEYQVKVSKSGRIFSNQIQNVEVPYLKCNKALIASLNEALTEMVHATEMVAIDNKIEMSIKFSSFCELLAMQIHLVKIGIEREEKLCPCVINQEQSIEKHQYFANYELSVPQILILNKNIQVKTDFSKAIFCRLMIVGDETYFVDFISRVELTDTMIENVVKLTQLESITKKQERILHDLVLMVRDCGLKFKLASLLGLKGMLQQLLNDEQSYHYLLDTKYGSADIF